MTSHGAWSVLLDNLRGLRNGTGFQAADAIDGLLDALVHAHDTMLMVNHADLGKTDREALYAAREHAKRAIDEGCPK